MTITLFEQSAFLIERDGVSLAVDAGSLTSPESLRAIIDARPAASLVTHIHGDHCDAANLTAIGAPVYTVRQVADSLGGNLQVSVHAAGDSAGIEGTGFSVEFVEADHGPNVLARHPDLENVGFRIEAGGTAAWYLGDMFNPSPEPTMPYDAVLIPVGNNGYTFGPEQALGFLRKIGWRGLTIPVHYNAKMHPESGERFAVLAKDVCDIRALGVGEPLSL